MKPARVGWLLIVVAGMAAGAGTKGSSEPAFQTSDRCVACHNGLTTASGQDVSIGYDWRASVMANSSRDPYWRASVRRETIDHGQLAAHIEDECSVCHMPIPRYLAKLKNQTGQVFEHFPFSDDRKQGKEAADGVSCSVCHQIADSNLGKRESFNGGFVVEGLNGEKVRPEYGPFSIEAGQQRIMRTSTEGFQPAEKTEHIRKSELCATCHTLITKAFGPDGKEVGSLPEQMPYQEWLHSDFRTKQTCQDCHMPKVEEPAPITRVFGTLREGVKRHKFVGANFLLQRLLNRFRDDLEVEVPADQLSAAAEYTVAYLKQKAARVSIENFGTMNGRVEADVFVENLGGHKLPTAFPSRRCWLHVTVKDRDGKIVFESGAVRADGSIVGNDNDADPSRYEPHYREIRSTDQVQIYEDILGDTAGKVTTGLLSAVRYLKDNRLLPLGFEKNGADPEIAVAGDALSDPRFTAGGDRVHYSIATGGAQGLRMEAELWYQPIGYRWAHNFQGYGQAPEPRRFLEYYEAMSPTAGEVLARTAAGQ